jgi:hypothetical protein
MKGWLGDFDAMLAAIDRRFGSSTPVARTAALIR